MSKNSKEVFNKNIKQDSFIYITLLSLFELSDKIFGATYVAFMRLRGLSVIQISNLFSIEQVLLAVFDYPTGVISDKFGRKKVFSLGFIIWGAGIELFCFGNGFLSFLPAIICLALGMGLISGSPSAWFIDRMIKQGVYDKKEEIYPKVESIIKLFSIFAAIISYFLLSISSQLTLATAGIISIIAGIMGLSLGKDNYGNLYGKKIGLALFSSLRDYFSKYYLIILSVKLIVGYISFIAFVLYWQIYATESAGLQTKYLGIVFILFMTMLMIGNFIVSKLSKYRAPFWILLLGWGFTAFGYLMLFINFTNAISVFIIGAVFIEIGFGVEQCATNVWISEYISSDVRSTYHSIFSTIECLSGFIIINILGFIAEHSGIRIIWGICFVSIIFTVLLLIYLNKFLKEEK